MTPERNEQVHDDAPISPGTIPIADTTVAPTDPIPFGPLDMGVGLSRLDPRFIKAERAGWAILFAILLSAWIVAAVLMLIVFDDSTNPVNVWVTLGGGAAFVFFIGVMGIIWPPAVYRHRAYRITDHGLQIRKGVWWRAIIDVPRSRVQHTDVTQGPLERRYGLGKLIVHTAGTMSATVELEGLSHDTALQLRDRLTGADDDESV